LWPARSSAGGMSTGIVRDTKACDCRVCASVMHVVDLTVPIARIRAAPWSAGSTFQEKCGVVAVPRAKPDSLSGDRGRWTLTPNPAQRRCQIAYAARSKSRSGACSSPS
jgi:hypothetical protein